MRILVCGDRHWSDITFICKILDSLNNEFDIECIIEGEAKGADIIARIWAEINNIKILPFSTDWEKYKKAAGPIRNRQMLKEGKPDLVVAFHDNIDESTGTKDMIEIARKANIEVRLFSHEPYVF